MNIQEKLEAFAKTTLQEAEDKRIEIQKKINAQLKEACEDIEAKAQEKADELYREEEYKAVQNKNRDVVHATLESKKSLYELREQLINTIFSNVRNMLYDYIEHDQYYEKLIKSIKDVAEKYDGEEIEIYVCDKDYEIVQEFERDGKIRLLKCGNEGIGGFKAVIKSKNIILEGIFNSLLEDEKESFSKFMSV